MEDRHLIRLPDRAWARCAAHDLEQAGYAAWVLDGPDPEGRWTVLVCGTRDQISALRDGTGPAPPGFCWESYVNAAFPTA